MTLRSNSPGLSLSPRRTGDVTANQRSSAGVRRRDPARLHWAAPVSLAYTRPACPGGGVTAGIDFVLALIAELRGPRAAEMVQLGLEYAPEPPFNSGRPDTAPAEVLEAVNARTATSRAQRRVRLDAWAAAHRAGHHA